MDQVAVAYPGTLVITGNISYELATRWGLQPAEINARRNSAVKISDAFLAALPSQNLPQLSASSSISFACFPRTGVACW
jgi:hypothetical protein